MPEQRDYGKRIGYAAVLTDENLIEKVLEQAESFIEKLQEGSRFPSKSSWNSLLFT